MKSLVVKKYTRVTIVMVLMAVLLLAVVSPAMAGEFVEGKPDAVLEEGEIVEDDLFIGGNDVLVAGIVEGDLFAAGENVVISGEVYGNVFAAGETVKVSGIIDGALMISGYDLILEDSASIGRNVYFGGFSFQTMRDSLVKRSIYGGGYQMVLSGKVDRDITAGLGALKITGPVGGDVNVEVGEPTQSFDSNFNYWFTGMPSIQVLDPGYVVDEDLVDGELDIKVTPVDTDLDANIHIDPGYFVLQALRRRAGEFIALMFVGMLALWLMRGTLLKAVDEVKRNAGMDTIWGILVYLLYIPVVFVLSLVLLMLTILVSMLTLGSLAGEMITISSFSFFGLLALFGMLAGLATKVVLGYLVGRWILGKTSELSYEKFWHHVGALAIGLFIYEVMRSIPFVGVLLMVVVVVIGTGAFFVLIKNALQKSASTTPGEVEVTPA
ncbi:MAG: polymer-forming cytoskeletal protein [Anaerolineales bacterium]|nr:polymer-forming cytoskeletal protein [Anaerolineales bacterium]